MAPELLAAFVQPDPHEPVVVSPFVASDAHKRLTHWICPLLLFDEQVTAPLPPATAKTSLLQHHRQTVVRPNRIEAADLRHGV